MAEKKIDLKIPRQSIIYMALCLAGLLIFIFGGIIPANQKLRDLDEKITAVKYQIEEQKTLAPLYISFQKQSEKKESEVLPLPPKGKLSPARIDTLPLIFRTAASMSGMSLISAVPNLSTLAGDAQFIPVDVILRGGIAAFRKFLIHIGGISYVHHIEEMEVQVRPDSRDYKLKIWIAIG